MKYRQVHYALEMLIILFVFLCGCSAKNIGENEKEEDRCYDLEESGFDVSGQEEIYAIGDCLYYFDIGRGALCSYDFSTESLDVLTEQIGRLWQAEEGLYYIVGQDVYEVAVDTLKFALSIPVTAEPIGSFGGTIYWMVHEIFEDELSQAEAYSLCKIYAQNTEGEAVEPELVYETNHNITPGSILVGGKLCTANFSGIYVIDIETGIINHVVEQGNVGLFMQGGYVFAEDNAEDLYQIDVEKNTVKKVIEMYETITVKDDVLYCWFGDELLVQNMEGDVIAKKMVEQAQKKDGSFCSMAVCGSKVVWRNWLTEELYVYDMETEEWELF